MRITAVLCLIFSATQVFAQKENDHAQQTKTSIKYHALVEAGLLEGEAKFAFHAQVINGIQYETWYGGLVQELIITSFGQSRYLWMCEKIFSVNQQHLFFSQTSVCNFPG